MSHTDNQRRQGTLLSPKNQHSLGYHATQAPFGSLQEGDNIIPASERKATPNSSATDTDKTYFSTMSNPEYSNSFIDRLDRSRRMADTTNSVVTPRTRYLTTAPSQDQRIDPNHGRRFLRAGITLAEQQGSTTPIRDAINYAKENAPRTASSQRVVEEGWGPVPSPEASHVAVTLPNVNWHQFGLPNWVEHYPDGSSIDSLDVYLDPLESLVNKVLAKRRSEGNYTIDQRKRSSPPPGVEQLDFASELGLPQQFG